MDILEKIAAVRERFPGIDLRDRDVLLANLGMLAQMIVASEGMLRMAIVRLQEFSGEYEQRLGDYFREHLAEETDHFKWICADLAGHAVVRNWLAAEVAGTQYYLIQHDHPAAILGYMAVLEGSPMPLSLVEELETCHGEQLLRTVRYHAVHDQDHRGDVLAMIACAPEHLQTLILENALHVAKRLGEAQQLFGGQNG